MPYLKLIPFVLIWIAFMALKLVVALLGLIAIPLMYRMRNTNYDQLRRWTRPWANPEDWHGGSQYKKGRSRQSVPVWWIDRYITIGKDHVRFGMWFRYHAIRNPANGLRSFEFLDLDIVPDKMGFCTPFYLKNYEPHVLRRNSLYPSTVWYLAWQGWQAGFKLVHLWNEERHLVIKLGWRIQPSDKTDPIDPAGIRHEDAGFASKFLLYRKG